MSNNTEEYTIFCIIPDGSSAFSVELNKNENVHDLKRAIKREKTPNLDAFAANTFELYRINAFGINAEERNKVLKDEIRRIARVRMVNTYSMLDAPNKLCNVFDNTTPPDNTYHIFVVVPLGEPYNRSLR